jgi:amino acid permease
MLTEVLSEEPTLHFAEGNGHPPGRSGVANAAMNIVAEIMGAGVLSLPHAVAALGWVLGLGSIIFFGLVGAYTGIILTRTKTTLYPEAESFADLATETVGPRFALFTRAAICTQWALLLPYFLIACVSSLRLALPHAHLCFVEWSFVAALCLLVPLQLQTLHTLSFAGGASTVAMLVATALVLTSLVRDGYTDGGSGLGGGGGGGGGLGGSGLGGSGLGGSGLGGSSGSLVAYGSHVGALHASTSAPTPPPARGNHSLWPPALEEPSAAGVLELAASVCAVVFAYQGQSIYLEIMREMRTPSRFGRAAVFANLLMATAYSVTVAVGYGAYGTSVAGFLPDSLREGPVRVAVGLLLALHLIVCYLITAQPLHRAIHAALFPADYDARLHFERPASATRWLAVTMLVLLFALVLAAAVPFFAQFQSLLGALTGVPTVCGWPPLFLLRGAKLKSQRVGGLERFCCNALLWFFTPILLVAGSVSAAAAVAEQWGNPQASPIAGCSVL